MAHPNEELVRKGYDAFSRGDMDTLRNIVFADNITFHIPGSNQLAGDYAGQEKVFGFLGKVMELTGGTFRPEVHDILANDEHAVALAGHTGQREGKSSNYRSVHVMHVRGGKIAEFWEHPDQPAFDAFWS